MQIELLSVASPRIRLCGAGVQALKYGVFKELPPGALIDGVSEVDL